MTVATGNFAELLWPGIAAIFGDSYDSYTPVYKKIFAVNTSDLAFEKVQGVTRLPLAGIKEQGQAVTYIDPVQGFQKEYIPQVYALGSSVTREMYTDDQYRYINGIPRWLARSIIQTEETDHANVLNDSFTTENSADSLTIHNAAHPNVATNTTQSNRPSTATDLTQTSLEQAFIDISDWTDDHDINIQVQPQLLVVPNELMWVATKILGTQGEVNSADNTINPMYHVMDWVWWRYLTDPDAWFIKTDVEQGYTCFVRWNTQLDRDNEFDTQNLKFIATRRWSRGLSDWRGSYGTTGA